MVEEVLKHSVHTLVFRSLKRAHDKFVVDNAKPIPLDEESHKVKMAVKLRTEYGSVLHMPTCKENLREKGGPNTRDPYGYKQYSGNQGQELEFKSYVELYKHLPYVFYMKQPSWIFVNT
ncbi:pleiotropic regulator 1 [Limosa lapponica baueri]|uniref:Pleiotropic regulator 1 n=1 Tax=Limosa lapponica baueri TaxID=1758121 RepID=A0A2I0U174_LIMLA|nr:pleiotropic regulator 1 [Limosa lapponica baueri]